MKSLNDVLKPVKDALLAVTKNVGHYEANDGTKTHIVYAEETESSRQSADNRKMYQTIQGTIDLYVKNGDEKMVDQLQEELNKRRISFYLNSVTSTEGELSGFVRYEWVFEVS